MLNLDLIFAHFERTIAERFLSRDLEGLRRSQWALVELVDAAEAAGDRESALRLRVLASKVANHREALADD
ncbi:MAG: hypothetical protein EI684_05450 [Candidatus Viridilinea halotolerans]|uniref:Uncharacterized protein n=1 Tax=Candidatus Viridilinea halotolerans TaxID=2491704 RepID=A0A426U580_9CHLR|nr:MAG: hypothetical protein EI684_05450 [Candidatus Viridilinea halotolerans]